MDKGNVEERLDRLGRLRAKLAAEETERDEARDELLKPLRKKLGAVEQEFLERSAPLLEKIKQQEEAVKAQVAELGESVKGSTLHAVYVRPRVSWDTGKLEGMIAFHPQIAEAKITAPAGTVQIRSLKEKGE